MRNNPLQLEDNRITKILHGNAKKIIIFFTSPCLILTHKQEDPADW